MGMSIEDTKTQLIMQKSYALGKDYMALENALDIMRKYQKIEDIVRNYYNEQYTDKLDIEIIEMISEVLCDGNDD